MEINKIINSDCLEVLKTMPENSVDSIVTDPPYNLTSISKRFGKDNSAPAKYGKDGSFQRLSGGFMGKQWDSTGITFDVKFWQECLRVLKPGGYLLSFGGTRTYHRMACAIEDAGFEIRDCILYIYGSGFPKSLNIWKQLKKNCLCGNMELYEKTQFNQKTIKEKANVAKRNESDTKHNLRYMPETDLPMQSSSEKKQEEILQSFLSEQSISTKSMQFPNKIRKRQSSVERGNNPEKTEGELQGSDLSKMPEKVSENGEERRIHNATQVSDGSTSEKIIETRGSSPSQRPQSEQQQNREPCAFCKQWGTQALGTEGWGTALKPAVEPIVVARKPLSEKNVASNVLKWGTGGLNIDESRIRTQPRKTGTKPTSNEATGSGNTLMGSSKNRQAEYDNQSQGRFPANLILECICDEVRIEPTETKEPEEVSGGIFHPSTGKPAGRTYKGGQQIHTNPECPCYILDRQSGERKVGWSNKDNQQGKSQFGIGNVNGKEFGQHFSDSGGASRFFYCAKASRSERNMGCEGLEEKSAEERTPIGQGIMYEKGFNPPTKNHHPTVKPLKLMEYLVRLVTPPKGMVLDPFLGSGTTAMAAKKLGFNWIGIEKEKEYCEIAEARINATRVENKLL